MLLLLLMTCVIHKSHQIDNTEKWHPVPNDVKPAVGSHVSKHVATTALVKKHGYHMGYTPENMKVSAAV